jgi:hypothetical protein
VTGVMLWVSKAAQEMLVENWRAGNTLTGKAGAHPKKAQFLVSSLLNPCREILSTRSTSYKSRIFLYSSWRVAECHRPLCLLSTALIRPTRDLTEDNIGVDH